MEETSFEPGDVVMLKSGGSAMTVVQIDGPHAHCIWITDEDEEIRTAAIPTVALVTVELEEDDEDEKEPESDEDEEDATEGDDEDKG